MTFTQTTYDDLVDRALAAAKAYTAGDPILSDAEFDDIVDQIVEVERSNPLLVLRADSPTQIVGAGEAGSTRHAHPMLSLSKITDMEKAVSTAKGMGTSLLAQLKLDGVSMSLEYRDGTLWQALTRGDGESGEDVTETMVNLPTVPEHLYNNFTGFVRGEVVIHRDELPKGLKNARNGAAGSINHKDPKIAAKRNCRFYAFDVLGSDDQSAAGALLDAKAWGFVLAPTAVVQEVSSSIAAMMAHRDHVPYDCDGVVIKVANYAQRVKMGNRSNSPRWAFAFKTAGETAQAKVLGLVTQVGKSGTIGLVYELEPTDLGGTTISRATAHNMSEVRRHGVMIGDTVTIRRAGEVIPRVECVTDPSSRTGAETRIETPTRCPGCDSLLQEFGNSFQLRCTGDDCSGTLVRRLTHWAGRSAADIDAVGPSFIEAMVDAGLLSSVADFYRLKRLDLLRLEGVEDGRATKFLDSIEKSKHVGMRRALIGLAIPSAGEGTAERLCRHFTSVEEVAQAELPRLASLDDIGVVVASSIVEFFDRPATKATLEELRSCGVSLDRLAEDAPLEISGMEGEFVGKKVCVTGALSVSRDAFHELLKQAGATIVKSVSGKTDILVIGKAVGKNKTDAAKKHSVRVITEEEARKYLP